MPLNIPDVAENPSILTYRISLPSGEDVTFRPLETKDVNLLAQFFENLSPKTRQYYILESYDLKTAQEMCDTINRYDKLRFVVTNTSGKKLIALFEFSFDIPKKDEERFQKYGIQLSSQTDYRMGPCIADEYQNRGVGTLFFPYLSKVGREFGRKRMILWGGVFSENKRAINFYQKCGFKKLGVFQSDNGMESVDMIIDI